MFDFMHAFNTVVIFLIIVVALLVLAIFVGIEIFDRVTGADVKRQAELARLRQLDDDEDGMYPR